MGFCPCCGEQSLYRASPRGVFFAGSRDTFECSRCKWGGIVVTRRGPSSA